MSRIIKANPGRILSGQAETIERNSRAPRGGESPLAGTVFVGDKDATPRKMRKGSGAPSFCWICHRQLQRAPGKGLGLFYFNLVRDRAGIEHRVHGEQCTREAVADGGKVVPEAQP